VKGTIVERIESCNSRNFADDRSRSENYYCAQRKRTQLKLTVKYKYIPLHKYSQEAIREELQKKQYVQAKCSDTILSNILRNSFC